MMGTEKAKKIISLLSLGVAITVSMGIGLAGQYQHGHGEFGRRGADSIFGRLAADLNLTDAQKTQIEGIQTRYRESTATLREQLRNAHASQTDPLNGVFNETQVRQAAQTRANLQVELEVANARMMSEVYAVLTPEQKTKIAERRQQWEQRRRNTQKPNGTTF